MFKQNAGWLVAAGLVVAMFTGAAISGPTTPSQYDGCVYTAAGIALSDGQPAVVQCDSTGHVLVAATATLTNPTIGAAVPATANYIAGNKGGLLAGVTIDTGGGLVVHCDGTCGSANPNGQATMANSAPVVIASNQSAIAVTAAQATASSLNATVVGTGTFAAQVTNTTATNLNAAVVGTGTAGTPAGNILTVQGVAAMTKLLVTPDSVALPANQSVNMAQVAGTTTDTNSGAKSAGTMRVVLATDQPQLTNKLLVTPDSVALPANQSVNVAQMNGVTTTMGNGVSGTGVQRVAIASDNTAFSVNGTLQTQTDTVMIGGVNVKEINGVTPLMGNGVTGTGSPRVTLSSDNTTLSNVFAAVKVDQTTPGTTNAVQSIPGTSGGETFTTLTLANSTNATNVKASAGQLYTISGFNMSSATPVWISLYNNGGTPTCGTSIVAQFMIPGSTTGAGFVYNVEPGMTFSTGIAFCATTGIAGTGAPAATTYVLNVGYK